MSEIALEVNHVSIDYKNLMHMSMHQALLKKDVKRADIVRAVDDVSFDIIFSSQTLSFAIKRKRNYKSKNAFTRRKTLQGNA